MSEIMFVDRIVIKRGEDADKLAVSLREILDMPRNERNAIDLLARVEKALVAYESEVRS